MDIYSTGEHFSPVWSLGHRLRFELVASWLLRLFWALCAVVLLTGSSGCSALQGVRDYAQYNDVTDEFVVGWRNYVWANKAWAAQKACYADHPYRHDFGEGFRAGYRDAAAGGNGCPPPLPPRKYWRWQYQSPEGQGKIAAWFEGYPQGAAVAEQEGASNWREIPVSYAIQQQYSPEFEQGLIPRCDGPVFPQPTDQWRSDPRGPLGPVQPFPNEAPRTGLPAFQDSSMRGPQSALPPLTTSAQTAMWSSYPITNPEIPNLPAAPKRPYSAWEPLGGHVPPAPSAYPETDMTGLDDGQRHDQNTLYSGHP